MSSVFTQIKTLRIRAEELNLKLDIVEKKLGKAVRDIETLFKSVDSYGETISVIYDKVFLKPKQKEKLAELKDLEGWPEIE